MNEPWLRQRLQTADPDEADALMRRLYEDGSLRRRSPTVAFRHELDGTRVLNISRFRFGGAFESAGELHNSFCVIQTLHGRYDWESDDERGTAATIELCRPGVRLMGRTAETETRVVTIDAADLARQAARIYGVGARTAAFRGATPVSAGMQRAWTAIADVAEKTLRDPALDAFPILRAAVERQLVVTTLEAFRFDVEVARAAVGRETVWRAIRFIDDHAAEPITVDDVAEHVGTPTVALDEAVVAQHGRSIADLLRRARSSGFGGAPGAITGVPEPPE